MPEQSSKYTCRGASGQGGDAQGEPPSYLSEGVDETIEFGSVIPVRRSKRNPWRSQDVDNQHQPRSRRFVECLVQFAVIEHDDLAFGMESHLDAQKADAEVNINSSPIGRLPTTMQHGTIEPNRYGWHRGKTCVALM